MASKYFLPRLGQILKNYTIPLPNFNNLIIRQSSYQNSKLVGEIDDYAKFEVTKSSQDWEYVERLLPKLTVPEPVQKSEYPSNWTPVGNTPTTTKFYIPRTRNHMLPVYLKITYRGMRKLTIIRKIQGDIFELSKELKSYLEKIKRKDIALQVNEFVGYIHIKGDHVTLVEDYLVKKGF